MAALKFRSQVEVLSVVDKGRRRDWTDSENERLSAIGPREIANGSSGKAFGVVANVRRRRGVTRFRGHF